MVVSNDHLMYQSKLLFPLPTDLIAPSQEDTRSFQQSSSSVTDARKRSSIRITKPLSEVADELKNFGSRRVTTPESDENLDILDCETQNNEDLFESTQILMGPTQEIGEVESDQNSEDENVASIGK